MLPAGITRTHPSPRLAGRRRAASVRAVLPLLIALTAGLYTGCGDGKATLSDLAGIDELKTRFNRDAGKPRIVLLLSPT